MYFGDVPRTLWRNVERLAGLIGADDVQRVALVDNTTTAVSAVCQTLAWQLIERPQRGATAVYFSTTYAAVKHCLAATVQRAGARLLEVPVPFPLASGAAVVDVLAAALSGFEDESFAWLIVLDHVTSSPSMVLPLAELVAVARRLAPRALVVVDGAHAFGQTPVDVGGLGVDFYCSNVHKWGMALPGAAVLYSRLPLHHPCVSHNYGQGMTRESMWTGTRDMSTLLSVDAALDFLAELGGVAAVAARNNAVVLRGRQLLSAAWRSEPPTPPELCGAMAMVALPYPALHFSAQADCLRLRTLLRQRYNIETVVMAVLPRGYVRISCQLYNTVDDYQALADAVLDIVDRQLFPADQPADLVDPNTAPPGPVN